MSRGIIVFGASGSGTSTLGRELAQKLGFQHFDLDDYFWNWDTEIPFTVKCPREERIERLLADISKYSNFVMSGCMREWETPFVPLFDLAVFVTTPTEMRIERLHAREYSRFGDRIHEGGDMYEEHKRFIDWAAGYDTMAPPERCLRAHEQWLTELPCPVLRVEGTTDPRENAAYIVEQFTQRKGQI
ncbi:MAG: AAA family ATPase [Oscillospiraceae bacterium]|nr:AAA family ATPase [Oscillospiraceae bacterium]